MFEATSSSILLIETESSETSDSDFDRARLIVRNISGRLKIIAFNNGMQLLNISVDERQHFKRVGNNLTKLFEAFYIERIPSIMRL